jgi:hypothetical protein
MAPSDSIKRCGGPTPAEPGVTPGSVLDAVGPSAGLVSRTRSAMQASTESDNRAFQNDGRL